MTKFFLQKFIPKTYFVLGHQGGRIGHREIIRTKEYSIQIEIPNRTISSLNLEQRKDPRLLRNIYLLILKLQNMYKMIKKINTVVDIYGKLDGKLDLGGLSKYVENKKSAENLNWDIIPDDFIKSPNLLVDPETMELYCIDFDKGIWNDEKEAAYTMLISLAKQDEKVMEIINKK